MHGMKGGLLVMMRILDDLGRHYEEVVDAFRRISVLVSTCHEQIPEPHPALSVKSN